VEWSAAVTNLRSLASQGRLVDTVRKASAGERALLSGAAFTLAWPIVFNRLTRVHELRRGHRTCAAAVDKLADGCLDRFHDDVEAVVDDLLTHATTKIANAEGWITSRLRAVTIDAHRRRRGARGALQRPRLPGWLVRQLDDDPWLGQLAIEILIWVGVPTTAGTRLWPLDSWAERRAAVTGDQRGSNLRTVERDVEHVLAQMRYRPRWYAEHVERPLGLKALPLAPMDRGAAESAVLWPVVPEDVTDTRLTALASVALGAIEKQLATAPEDKAAVGRILRTVFGRIDTDADFIHLPDQMAGRVGSALVDDEAELHRIVDAVRQIVVEGATTRSNHGRSSPPVRRRTFL